MLTMLLDDAVECLDGYRMYFPQWKSNYIEAANTCAWS